MNNPRQGRLENEFDKHSKLNLPTSQCPNFYQNRFARPPTNLTHNNLGTFIRPWHSLSQFNWLWCKKFFGQIPIQYLIGYSLCFLAIASQRSQFHAHATQCDLSWVDIYLEWSPLNPYLPQSRSRLTNERRVCAVAWFSQFSAPQWTRSVLQDDCPSSHPSSCHQPEPAATAVDGDETLSVHHPGRSLSTSMTLSLRKQVEAITAIRLKLLTFNKLIDSVWGRVFLEELGPGISIPKWASVIPGLPCLGG